MRARLLGGAAVTILAAGCTSTSTSTNTTAASTGPSTAGDPTTSGDTRPAGIRVQLTISDTRLTGELLDNATARALAAQLPLTLTMSDLGSVEKVGELPMGLSTAGAPRGADPSVGDIGLYAPWNNFVLYYGDQSYHDGIIQLGTLDGSVDEIARQHGEFTLTIERI
jgi:hypothetical protein